MCIALSSFRSELQKQKKQTIELVASGRTA